MAFRHLELRATLLAAMLASWAAAPRAAAPEAAPRSGCPRFDMKWEAMEGNLRGGEQHIRALQLSSCDVRGIETIRVTADEATGPNTDFVNGEWRLTRNVVVTIPDGELRGDKAAVVLKNSAIASATVNGAPANFAQHAAASAGGISNAHGAAPEFHYEVASGDVSMSGGAFIAYQDTEFRCSLIIYNLTSQKYRGIAARDKGEVCRGQTHAGNPPATEPRPAATGSNAP